jgi:hypothetical protein
MNTQTTTQTTTETTPIKKCKDRSYVEAFTDFFTGKKCEEDNTEEAKNKIPVVTTNEGSVAAVPDVPSSSSSSNTNPAASGQPATKGGWFSRGGKRKSKAKKSRRKNRKQRKSRKSRK